MKFAKLCCGGNDFIVIHGESAPVGERLPDLARRVCTRRFGVGADGLIVLNPHEELPFRMQLFNADGSTAEISFNGSRCVGLFAFGDIDGISQFATYMCFEVSTASANNLHTGFDLAVSG